MYDKEDEGALKINSDSDCVSQPIEEDLSMLKLFFSMFHGLTQYVGIDEKTGHKVLKLAEVPGVEVQMPDIRFYYSDAKPSVLQAISYKADKHPEEFLNVVEITDGKRDIDDEFFEFQHECRLLEGQILKETHGSVVFTIKLLKTLMKYGPELKQLLEEKAPEIREMQEAAGIPVMKEEL